MNNSITTQTCLTAHCPVDLPTLTSMFVTEMSTRDATGDQHREGTIAFVPPRYTFPSTVLERLSGINLGALTEEGLFLLMSELIEAQNELIRSKAQFFKEQTMLQKKYAQCRDIWNKLQGIASNADGKNIKRENVESLLTSLGYNGAELENLLDRIDPSDDTLEPDELQDMVNFMCFGDDSRFYVTVAAYSSSGTGSFKMNEFTSGVLEKIDAAQENNCADTTLLTSELQSLTSQNQRYTQMLTNLLKNFHDRDMSVIRNL